MYWPTTSPATCKQELSGKLVIGAVLHRNGDFVPQEGEVARVVENRLLEHEAIGNAHDTTVVLIALDPIAALHERGSQDADIDDVALDPAELHAVARLVVTREGDGEPTRNAGDHLLQRERHSGSRHPEGHREAAEPVTENRRDHENPQGVAEEGNKLPRPIAHIAVLDVAPERALGKAHQSDNDENTDYRGDYATDGRIVEPSL